MIWSWKAMSLTQGFLIYLESQKPCRHAGTDPIFRNFVYI
jgi:hypothetical protein